MDLQDALARRKATRRGHFFDQRLDVGAEELERAVAGLADQVKVPGMTVRVLEAEPSLAEVDLPRDPGVHHPLQRAVDGRPADAVVFLADQIDEIFGGEVPFLTEEDVDDELALARSFVPAGRRLS